MPSDRSSGLSLINNRDAGASGHAPTLWKTNRLIDQNAVGYTHGLPHDAAPVAGPGSAKQGADAPRSPPWGRPRAADVSPLFPHPPDSLCIVDNSPKKSRGKW